MSAVLKNDSQILHAISLGNQSDLDDLMRLRSGLVCNHQINAEIKNDVAKLFRFFELYAYFVYNFSFYVCELFTSLKDDGLKVIIYENLLEELGVSGNQSGGWRSHHGEMYRQFIQSLRQTSIYPTVILPDEISILESKSKKISEHFYSIHRQIIAEEQDSQSLAAFSTIECWVSQQYGLWKNYLSNIGEDFQHIDIRTIDMHCVCDVEHSASLDALLSCQITRANPESIYGIKIGILRGMSASEQMFTDIRELLG